MNKILILHLLAILFSICAHASIPFDLLDQNKFDELKSFIETTDESVLTKIEEQGLSSHWIVQKRTILMSIIEKPNIDESIRHNLIQTYISRIKGNDLDLADQDGNTALIYSLYRGQIGLIDAMQIVQAGANPNVIASPGPNGTDGGTRGGGASPLILVSSGGQGKFEDSVELAEFVKILIKHGADPNQSGFYSFCPLQYASSNGMGNVVTALLSSGANVYCGSGGAGGQNALITAAGSGSTQAVTAILDFGILPDDVTNERLTALGNAAWNGNDEIVDLLIRRGAKIDLTSEYFVRSQIEGATPLFLAALNSKHSTAQLLLKNSADPNVITKQNQYGRGSVKQVSFTALSMACRRGDLKMVDILISGKANTEILKPINEAMRGFFDGYTDGSKYKTRLDMIQLLLENGTSSCGSMQDFERFKNETKGWSLPHETRDLERRIYKRIKKDLRGCH